MPCTIRATLYPFMTCPPWFIEPQVFFCISHGGEIGPLSSLLCSRHDLLAQWFSRPETNRWHPMDLYLKAKIKNPPEQVGFQWPCGISVNCFQDKKNADPGSAFVSALFKGRWWRGSFRGSWKGLAGGGGTVMRGQLSPQNTSTGADSRPKMPGKAHRMAIYKNRKRVSELSLMFRSLIIRLLSLQERQHSASKL